MPDVLTIRARKQAKVAPGPETAAFASLGEPEPFLFTPGTEMERLIEKVFLVAPQDTTIMLTGETGTGKSRLARLIHESSPRRNEPFQVVNCGALSGSLMESELFGHVQGAFTGADRDRTGRCAQVGRGTLMLDEVDTLTLEMQAKLLRVVEDRVFEPVGSNRLLNLEARLIVASNRHLPEEMANGRFRTDLYYRLNVVEFHLRSLREQPQLLRPLVENFLFIFAGKRGRKIHGFTPAALEALEACPWPGNIREVRNIIERAVALTTNPAITLEDLPPQFRERTVALKGGSPLTLPPSFPLEHAAAAFSPAGSTLIQMKEEAESARIAQVLAKHSNNRQRTAVEVDISRMTLYNKLHRYGLMGAT